VIARRVTSAIVLVMILAVPAFLTGLVARREVTLEITHRARTLQPGEVVVLEVQASEPHVSMRATAFGQSVRFYQTELDDHWRGLIGIDLTVAAGDYPIAVRAASADGATVRETHTIAVLPKDFPTRRLNVDPSFVSPPPDVFDRIQREARQVAEIFRVSSGERLWSGSFLAPVPGEATSSFGRRSVFNGQPRSPHSGTDFRAGAGVPVRAPNAGRVILTGDLYFSGKVVILDHGLGLYSYFAHLSAIDVSEGETVRRGEVVGKVGATGRVTGAHLHWTVRLNDARVDPLSLMTLFPE